jgi:uncharacterized protein YndB with AHSA1/START domain
MAINENAPVITRDEIRIEAPLELVWAVQTDVAGWPRWRSDVDGVIADGPLAPGVSFRWQTAGLDITSTVVAVEPMRRLEWGGPAAGITGVHVWTFGQAGDGVVVRTEESWAGAPVDAAVAELQAALDASLAVWLRDLRVEAERRR